MKKTMRSAELQAQLYHLATLPDDQIDIADIPEAPAENWQHVKRSSPTQSLIAALKLIEANFGDIDDPIPAPITL